MRLEIVTMMAFLLLCTFSRATLGGPVPRSIHVSGMQFIETKTGKPIVLTGPNVVVKGNPYLPSVDGSNTGFCSDVVNVGCEATGTCKSCETFTQADVNHLKAQGWNAIRLGVVWAGGQPSSAETLDPEFERRLHALLNLTDQNGIHVMLDLHGDMVGTAGCGNGVPIWVQTLAAGDLIGKPLTTAFPYDLFVPVDKVPGFDHCGAGNESAWARFAGDPNYNLLNECCQAMNSNNPGGLGFTTISQRTMDFIMYPGPGRDLYVAYWNMLARAVVDHPSAYAAELFNEPMFINRRVMFDTWRALQTSINSVIPDMAVSVSDIGEGAIFPWYVDLITPDIDLDDATIQWLKKTDTLFLAWHWYGFPSSIDEAIYNVQALMQDWNMPSFATEFGDCIAWKATAAAGISHTYWHYSSYCTTGPFFGNRRVPEDTFGACILGWAGGNSSKCS